MESTKIDHINLKIPEDKIDTALKFYRDLLGLEAFKLEDFRAGERTSFFMKLGSGELLNIRPSKDFSRPEEENLDHFCLLMDSSIEDMRAEVKEKGFEILREGTPLGSEGRAPALYVKDPFGYKIELKEGP
jgi:catechol 2,3-dioxygenase-like lactoylglutathione lyase family enzyme